MPQLFLAKNCVTCHSDKVQTANLNLQRPPSREVWQKILEKLTTGRMPPPGVPAPPKADVAAVTAWIEGMLGPRARAADPGRVTARRLNRMEYNYTVRDLL